MHPHTTVSVAPLPRILGLHCLAQSSVSPSPWQPPGPGAAKNRKTQRLPAGMEKCTEQTAQKYMHKICLPGGHPST